LIELITDRF